MAAIDHLVLACPHLEEGVDWMAEQTGTRAVPGGRHVGVGTHNALLSFDETTYFEIIGIDESQPAPNQPRPFGLDFSGDLRLVTFAVRPTDGETTESLARTLADAGFDPGPVRAMSRKRPDGVEIQWQLSQPGATQTPGPEPAVVPFLIDWGDTPSPARSAPVMGALIELCISHPDPAARAAVAALDLGPVVTFVEGPPSLTAIVETTNGTVEIRP